MLLLADDPAHDRALPALRLPDMLEHDEGTALVPAGDLLEPGDVGDVGEAGDRRAAHDLDHPGRAYPHLGDVPGDAAVPGGDGDQGDHRGGPDPELPPLPVPAAAQV